MFKLPSNRVFWVDYAKGITIILVVLFHTTYENLYSEPFVYFNSLLAQMRMPFFFFISGLFIHRSFDSEKNTFMKRKIYPLLYLFVLWSVIRYFVDSAPRKFLLGQEANLNNLFTIFIDPLGTYWYIYALLIYLFITYTFRSRLKTTMVLALIFFSITIILGEANFLMKLSKYYPMFLLGHFASDLVIKKATKIRSYHLIIPAAFFVFVAFFKGTNITSNPLGVLFINCFGIVSGIVVSVLSTKIKYMSWLTNVGRNTLPIYVLHFVPQGALKIVLPHVIPNQPELAVILMLVTGVTFPLLIVYLSKKMRMEWLFNMPSFFSFKKAT